MDNFVFLLTAILLGAGALPDADLPCTPEICPESQSEPAKQVLLQSHKKVVHAPVNFQAITQNKINPSGAAAPLSEDGYAAVADRCCQAEMRQFIERQVSELGLEVCEEAGLFGIIPYHSCEKGPQTFDALTANLLNDASLRCTWISPSGQCQPIPEDCDQFGGVPPDRDCSCSRSLAAQVTMENTFLTSNNFGGLGGYQFMPPSGPEEIVLTNAGLTSTGESFDVVIHSAGDYHSYYPEYNSVFGGFGGITMAPNITHPKVFPGEMTVQVDFYSTGTRDPLTINEIHLATFDLDGDAAGGLEYVSSKGYKGYVTDTVPNIGAARLSDGRTQFISAGVQNNIPNPTDPDTLTTVQRACSVMYFYENVNSVELTFGLQGASQGAGRFLFFSFSSSLKDRCGP
jgi:hypothetical protein